jgi:hypothetical protein
MAQQDDDQSGLSPSADIQISPPAQDQKPGFFDALAQGVGEGASEVGLHQTEGAGVAAQSITDMVPNSFEDVVSNGISPLINPFFAPLMQHMPGHKEAVQKAQKAWAPGIFNNGITDLFRRGIAANKFTDTYYKGEDLAKLVSKAGQQQKLDIQTTGGLAAISPVNLAATATRALTNDAWRDVAKYGANRIAYHASKIGAMMLEGALTRVPQVAVPGAFALESAGRNAEALKDRQDITYEDKKKIVLMKAAADGFMAHVMTAIPGISNEIMPFATKLIGTMGRTGERALQEGIKKFLSESVLQGLPRDAINGFVNMASNQIANICIDQYYKVQEWHIRQAIIATVQAGAFGALVQSILGPAGRMMTKAQIYSGMDTWNDLTTKKLAIEGYMTGVPDEKGMIITVPHITDGVVVEKLATYNYALKNGLWRDADSVYRHIVHFNDGLKAWNAKGGLGLPPLSKRELADKIKWGGKTDEELKAEGITAQQIKEARGETQVDKLKQKVGELKEERDWREGEIKITNAIQDAKAAKEAHDIKEGFEEKIKELKYGQKWDEAEKNTAQDKVRKFVHEHLPIAERGKFLTDIQKANDPFDLGKTFAKVLDAREAWQKKTVISNIKDLASEVKNSTSIDVGYRRQILNLLDLVNKTAPREETIKKLQATKDYIASEKAAGREVQLPQYIYERMRVLNRTNLSSMNLNNLKDFYNEMADLKRTGEHLADANASVYNIEKQNMASRLAKAQVEPFGPTEVDTKKSQPIGTQPNLWEKAKTKWMQVAKGFDWRYANKSFMNAAHFFDSFGPDVYSLTKAPYSTKNGNYEARYKPLEAEAEKVQKDLNITPESNTRIKVWAALQQEGGREKLLKGYSGKELETQGKRLDAFQQEGLKPNEQKAYDWLRQQYEAIHPEYADHRRVVYNDEVHYQKNFSPLTKDFSQMDENEIYESMHENNPYALQKNVSDKHAISRTDFNGAAGTSLDAFGDFKKYMSCVLYDIEVGKWIRQMQEIASSDKPLETGEEATGENFRQKFGVLGQRAIREWLDASARKANTDDWGGFRLVNWFGENLGVTKLADPFVYLKHYINLINGAAYVQHHVISGLHELLMNPLCARAAAADPVVQEGARGVDSGMNFSKDALGTVKTLALKPITDISMQARGATWAGGVQKWYVQNAPSEKIDWQDIHPDAVDYARKITDKSQPAAHVMAGSLAKISGLGVGGSPGFSAAVFRFMNPLFTKWGMVNDMARLLKTDPAAASSIAGSLLCAALAEAGMNHGRKVTYAAAGALLSGRAQQKREEDPIWCDTLKYLAKDYPPAGLLLNSYEYGSVPAGPVLDTVKQMSDDIHNSNTTKKLEGKLKWALITGVKASQMLVPQPFMGNLPQFISHTWKIGGDKAPEWEKELKSELDWEKDLKNSMKAPK